MYNFIKEMLNEKPRVSSLDNVIGETLHISDVVTSGKNTFITFNEHKDIFYILPEYSAKYVKFFKLAKLEHFLYNRIVTIDDNNNLSFRIDELFNLYDIVKKCNDNIKEL
ncbi:hypothetical protein [Bacteriophage sp.]|nr:hypothetical protein [Bacteriophage sp.]